MDHGMEHIIKQDEFETIKRFELNGKSIWVIKKTEDGETNFGIGETKKKAEKNLRSNTSFANKGVPNFLNELGSIYKSNNRPLANSVPKSVNFIKELTPLSWHTRYIFRVMVNSDASQTFVEIMPCGERHMDEKPYQFWSDDKKGHHQQVINCIYEFYIQKESGIEPPIQHKKLGEWQKYWYSKLVPKSL